MSTTAISSATSMRADTQESAKGHVGLVVLASIAVGLALGFLLVLGVFAGADEPHIVGSALIALGAGFALLAAASSRFTNAPQSWALVPGVSSIVAGLAVFAVMPDAHLLDLAGWVWPVLLAMLAVSSFRGARRSLHD
jgi:hypothetical protein